jgi:parallel beta-helix repeat protein
MWMSMQGKARRPLAKLLMLFILASSFVMPAGVSWQGEVAGSGDLHDGFCTGDEPIIIDSVGEFASYGIPGSGSESDPYRIEGFYITETWGWCIRVLLRYENIHVVVRDCQLISDSGAIDIRVSGGITIERCTIIGDAIMRHAGVLHFRNCTLQVGTGDIYGIGVGEIADNTFLNTEEYAIDCNAEEAAVTGNTFTDCELGVGTWWPGTYHVEHNWFDGSRIGIFCNGADTHVDHNNFTNCDTAIDAAGVTAEHNVIDECDVGLHIFTNGGDLAFRHNNVSATRVGIEAVRSYNCNISENDIQVTGALAMDLDRCCEFFIINNRMMGGGIRIENYTALGDTLIVEGNTVNRLTLLVLVNQKNAEVDGSGIAQGFLVRCLNCTIIGGSFQDLPVGIVLQDSDDSEVKEASFINCTSGLYIHSSENSTIKDCIFVDCGLDVYGMELSHYYHEVVNVTIDGRPMVMAQGLSDEPFNITECGELVLVDGDNVTLTGEYMSGGSTGVTLAGCANCRIAGMSIIGFSQRGLLLFQSVNCTVSENHFEGNEEALVIVTCTDCVVMNNTFIGNVLGLHAGDRESVFRPVANSFYYNNFTGNSQNALDQECGNLWDDGMAMGNWWTPYYGGCVLIPVTGISYYEESNWTRPADRYPNGQVGDPFSPVIVSIGSLSMAEGEVGVDVEWDVRDSYLGYYYIYVNGSLVKWERCGIVLPRIFLSLNGFTVGYYNITLMAMDLSLNSSSDMVALIVVSETASSTSGDGSMAAAANLVIWLAAAAVALGVAAILIRSKMTG